MPAQTKRFWRISLILICLLMFPMTSLSEMIMPAEMHTIEAEAFMGTAAADVILHEGTRKILSRAFADCDLRQITIPASVTQIAPDAFEGCQNLVIRGYVGSFAEQYAEQYHYEFRVIDPRGDNGWFLAPENAQISLLPDGSVRLTWEGNENAAAFGVYEVFDGFEVLCTVSRGAETASLLLVVHP